MTLLTFIHFNLFTSAWRELGLADDDLRALETAILVAPDRAPLVPGTGGLRKLRFAPPGWHMGKRGALRVGYVYFEDLATVGLVAAYAKRGKADVGAGEKKLIRQLIDRFRALLEVRGTNGGDK